MVDFEELEYVVFEHLDRYKTEEERKADLPLICETLVLEEKYRNLYHLRSRDERCLSTWCHKSCFRPATREEAGDKIIELNRREDRISSIPHEIRVGRYRYYITYENNRTPYVRVKMVDIYDGYEDAFTTTIEKCATPEEVMIVVMKGALERQEQRREKGEDYFEYY